MSKQLDLTYASVDRRTAEAIRVDVDGSRYTWRDAPTYSDVRALVNSFGARDYIRLEVGRSPGTRYNSLWYVSDGKNAMELSTGEGAAGVEQRAIPEEQWVHLKAGALKAVHRAVSSRISSTISDSPVYFYCAHVDGKDLSFVLDDFPERNPQFEVIRETLELSQFKKMPRELSIFVDGSDRNDHSAHPDEVP